MAASKSVTVYWRGNQFRVFQRIISSANVRQSYRRNVGTWKQAKKNTRTVASCNNITKNFSKLKGWPSQSLIDQSLLRKSTFGSGLTDTFSLEITHVRGDACQSEAMRFKQSVTVHEKSRKAEPSNVHWKRAMKLIFSYSLFQTQLLWWFDSSSILPFPVS